MFDLLIHELRRKAIHITGSLIPITYYFLDRDTAVIILFFINVLLILVEWLRLNGKITIPRVLLRPHEHDQVAAYIYFQLAALFSILIFEKSIAIASLLMLSIGDTASGIAGAVIKGGNVRATNNRSIKPLPIMVVMFSVCILIGMILQNMPHSADMISLSFSVYLAGALGATIGDAVPVRIRGRTIDDNLMIPLLAGFFMTIAWMLN